MGGAAKVVGLVGASLVGAVKPRKEGLLWGVVRELLVGEGGVLVRCEKLDLAVLGVASILLELVRMLQAEHFVFCLLLLLWFLSASQTGWLWRGDR